MTRGIRHLIADEATTLYVDYELTTREIGLRLHAAESTVQEALRDNGIKLRPAGKHGRTYTRPLDMLRTQVLYEKGLTSNEVGEVLGVTGSCVRTRLKKMGVTMRRSGGIKLTPAERLASRMKDTA